MLEISGSPQNLHPIFGKLAVVRDHRESVKVCLGDDQSIKWVRMVQGQLAEAVNRAKLNWKQKKPVLPTLFLNYFSQRLPQNELAFLVLQLHFPNGHVTQDRKSTRLNSSHVSISYAVFCLKKKIK